MILLVPFGINTVPQVQRRLQQISFGQAPQRTVGSGPISAQRIQLEQRTVALVIRMQITVSGNQRQVFAQCFRIAHGTIEPGAKLILRNILAVHLCASGIIIDNVRQGVLTVILHTPLETAIPGKASAARLQIMDDCRVELHLILIR